MYIYLVVTSLSSLRAMGGLLCPMGLVEVLFEEKLESLYIKNGILHVQDEALYKLSYTNLKQLAYIII